MKINVFVLVLLMIMTSFDICYASNIDDAGNRILGIVRNIGYWVILVKALADVISSALRGDLHGAGRLVMQYTLIYAALFFVPFCFRLVEGIF